MHIDRDKLSKKSPEKSGSLGRALHTGDEISGTDYKELLDLCAGLKDENAKLKVKLSEAESHSAKLRYLLDVITASIKYQVADELVKASFSFKDALSLPFRLFWLYRAGKRSMASPTSRSKWIQPVEALKSISAGESKECMLFMPTNGTGLGHLTRLMAIAKRVRQNRPEIEIVFYTTSIAMPLIIQEGFIGYYLPSKAQLPAATTNRQWDQLLRNQLDTIFDLHTPNTLVFDGTFPYEGLVSAMNDAKGLRRVWVQRGERKKKSRDKVAGMEKYFDLTIIPGEAGGASEEAGKRIFRTDPVIFLDKSELLDHDTARKLLMAPEASKIVYVQLGAGNISDTSSTIAILLSVLKERDDIHVVLGESLIGKRLDIALENGIVLRDYPNSRYFNAFDLAVSAAGYNSFHELMYFGVPTIFIPNEQTVTDDQIARTKRAENAGAAIVVRESLPDGEKRDALEREIGKMVEKKFSQRMRKTASELVKRNGADDIVSILSSN